MIRRPFGSIDPNSIRETELHTECRRRRERESLNSPQHDRERDAARRLCRVSAACVEGVALYEFGGGATNIRSM